MHRLRNDFLHIFQRPEEKETGRWTIENLWHSLPNGLAQATAAGKYAVFMDSSRRWSLSALCLGQDLEEAVDFWPHLDMYFMLVHNILPLGAGWPLWGRG